MLGLANAIELAGRIGAVSLSGASPSKRSPHPLGERRPLPWVRHP